MGRVTGTGMVWEICNLDRRKKSYVSMFGEKLRVWREIPGMKSEKNREQVESGFDFIGNKKNTLKTELAEKGEQLRLFPVYGT